MRAAPDARDEAVETTVRNLKACGERSRSTTEVWLGIDVGTQGVRAALVTASGERLAEADAPLEVRFPAAGLATVAPQAVWEALVSAVSRLDARARADSIVRGIGLDATASLLLVDSAYRPLTDILLWMDLRAAAEAEEIGHALGAPESAELPWPKALWLVRHEGRRPQARHLMEVGDWVTHQLTGEVVRSRSNAILKWHADRQGRLPVERLRSGGVPEAERILALMPAREVVLGQTAGLLALSQAGPLHLPAGIPVACHVIDAYAGALGAGAVRPGRGAVIAGTSTCTLLHAAGDPWRSVRRDGFWGPFEGVYGDGGPTVLEAGQVSTGSVLAWLRQIGGLDYGEMDRLAQAVAPGAEGLRLFPAWQGVRSPRFDPDARGQMHGLSLGHGIGHLARAAYEGFAFDLRRILEATPDHATSVSELTLGGGMARSAVWRPIVAAVLAQRLRLGPEGAVLRGAAGLAMLATGAYADLSTYCAQVATQPIEAPDACRAAYDALYLDWLETFHAHPGASDRDG